MSKDDVGLLRTDPVLNQQAHLAPRPRKTHELKTWPEFFNATRCGRKKFELRRNDRDYQVGDHLLLKEWDPHVIPDFFDPVTAKEKDQKAYTGRELTVRVDYVMDAATVAELTGHVRPTGEGYVIMSISPV